MEACLTFDPFSRPNLASLLNHPWLRATESKGWIDLVAASGIDLAIPKSTNTEDPAGDSIADFLRATSLGQSTNISKQLDDETDPNQSRFITTGFNQIDQRKDAGMGRMTYAVTSVLSSNDRKTLEDSRMDYGRKKCSLRWGRLY